MSDVFISYKRENLAAVNRLVEALRAEGVGVWWRAVVIGLPGSSHRRSGPAPDIRERLTV